MASARLKVLASLPPEWQADAQHVNARFHLDAVWRARRLHIRYESWNGVRERDVEPLGLVLKAGIWYVAARTGAGAEPRTYRVSNILALTPLAQHFKAPRGFDLAAHWQESTRRFETGVYNETASLRVSTRGWRLLREFSTAVAEAADRSAVKEPRGWLRVSVLIESVAHAANQLIKLGADAEVLASAALRAQLRLTARRLVKLYAGRSERPLPIRPG